MSEAAARRLAHAIRLGAARHSQRVGPGRYEATVTHWAGQDDFILDVHGQELELDQDDVSLGQTVRKYDADVGIAEDDSLILIEVDDPEGGAPDYVAVEVRSDNG
jgi:hypothetical protein